MLELLLLSLLLFLFLLLLCVVDLTLASVFIFYLIKFSTYYISFLMFYFLNHLFLFQLINNVSIFILLIVSCIFIYIIYFWFSVYFSYFSLYLWVKTNYTLNFLFIVIENTLPTLMLRFTRETNHVGSAMKIRNFPYFLFLYLIN